MKTWLSKSILGITFLYVLLSSLFIIGLHIFENNMQADFERKFQMETLGDFILIALSGAGLYVLLSLRRRAETERTRAQMELRKWETIFQHAAFGMMIVNPVDDTIITVNPALARMYGYEEAEMIGKPAALLFAPESRPHLLEYARQVHEGGFFSFETFHQRKDGTIFPAGVDAAVIRDDRGRILRAANVRDLTERRQAEQAHQNYVAFLETTRQVDRIILGAEDLEGMLNDILAEMLQIFGSDRAWLLFPCDPQSPTWCVPMEKTVPEYPGVLSRGMKIPMDDFARVILRQAIETNGVVTYDLETVKRMLGEDARFGVQSQIHMAIHPKVGQPWMLGMHQCAFERQWSEQEINLFHEIGRRVSDGLSSLLLLQDLKMNQARLNEAQRVASIGSWELDIQANVLVWSDEIYRMFGMEPQAFKATYEAFLDAIHPEDREMVNEAYTSSLKNRTPYSIEHRLLMEDGSVKFVHEQCETHYDESGQPVRSIGTVQDITERKQAEENQRRHLREMEALNVISTALRAAQTVEEALPILLDQTLIALGCEAGEVSLYDPSSEELRPAQTRGWFSDLKAHSMKPGEGITGMVYASGKAYRTDEFARDPLVHPDLIEQIPPGWGGACVPIRSESGTVGVLFVSMRLPNQVSPEAMKLLQSLAEMAGATLHRLRLYEETARRLSHIQALQTVDRSITGNLDMRVTLNLLLEQAVSRLTVDAAGILLFEPRSLMLAPAAWRGFRSRIYEESGVRLGKDLAGRAALERRMFHIHNLSDALEFTRENSIAGEGFVCYHVAPLVAKGQILGALELFLRAHHPEFDQDWHEFFAALASQAAIAIDNARLFENLQLSNTELSLAYDATIEGWSRAMELRDDETEGHTQRVTELTMNLARAMGIENAEQVHIRRGALLHDIGKIGVPDGILLKPGKLTDDEWAIVRKHPVLAHQMLQPIAFLRPALDIPYCHHEKWDGSGYPHGLKGEQIPLAARLFAVVDVYDALTSDRPYRSAWPREKALEYIREQSGSHFDPQVVDAFLRME